MQSLKVMIGILKWNRNAKEVKWLEIKKIEYKRLICKKWNAYVDYETFFSNHTNTFSYVELRTITDP